MADDLSFQFILCFQAGTHNLIQLREAWGVDEASQANFNCGEGGFEPILSAALQLFCVLGLLPLCCIYNSSLERDGELYQVDRGVVADDTVCSLISHSDGLCEVVCIVGKIHCDPAVLGRCADRKE